MFYQFVSADYFSALVPDRGIWPFGSIAQIGRMGCVAVAGSFFGQCEFLSVRN